MFHNTPLSWLATGCFCVVMVMSLWVIFHPLFVKCEHRWGSWHFDENLMEAKRRCHLCDDIETKTREEFYREYYEGN